jgi:hypothetical protein
LLRWWVAPVFERLPTDFVAETRYRAAMETRETSSSAPEKFDIEVLRRDQALKSSAEHSVVQGDAHWLTPSGAPIFETLNTYGVDRSTRRNLPGYGDQERHGQYLFPPHTGKQQYGFWDPLYAGPWVATFNRVEEFRGIEVYVFDAVTDGIDETASYDARPEIPEKYRAHTEGKGRLWVEPVSGVVVDQEDAGVSYFIEPETQRRIGEPFNQWRQRYTEQTVAAQLRQATAARWRMQMLERWAPLGLAGLGLLLAAGGLYGLRRIPR